MSRRTAQAKNGTVKRRYSKTGAGEQIQVRLNPVELRIVERLAGRLGITRPEALRQLAFDPAMKWAAE